MLRFSFVIPTRDRHAFLKEAICSILNQHSQPLQIIVVDDGDGAKDVVAPLSPIVCVIDNERQGPVPARIRGVAAARGDCIVFLDDDDRLSDRNYLADITRAFEDGADFCFGDGTLVFEDGRAPLAFSLSADVKSLEKDNTILISAVSYRRALHERLGIFDSALPYYWDWDWYLRVARSGAQLHHLAKPVVDIRVHASNMSGEDTRSQRQANLDAFAAKHRLGKLVLKNHLSLAEDASNI